LLSVLFAGKRVTSLASARRTKRVFTGWEVAVLGVGQSGTLSKSAQSDTERSSKITKKPFDSNIRLYIHCHRETFLLILRTNYLLYSYFLLNSKYFLNVKSVVRARKAIKKCTR
jgi:hypothetical protein